MKSDLLSINGKLCRRGEEPLPFDEMMAADFVYQRLHTLGHKVLHAQAHAELADAAYLSLYGTHSGVTAGLLREEAAMALEANRYPHGSVTVMLYLLPGYDGKPIRIISCEKQLLYKGYALWHAAVKAIVAPYEYPFPHFKTGLSLAAGAYAARYASRKGATIAIAENNSGTLTGIGDEPLFAVMGNRAMTTPVGQGACDSVERRLALAACEKAGMEITETPLSKEMLTEYQELFTVTPGGVVSIRECGGNIYPNSTANRVASAMEAFSAKDI